LGTERRAWEKDLAGKTGRAYWQSLADLALGGAGEGEPEFARGEDERPDEPTRRSFLKLLGASMALAGVTGCVKDPVEKILPYTVRPPEVTPGRSRYYATSMPLGGYATGLLVESREGRPIKIEGNPEHPASLGATGVFEQASILGLYDPHRARSILHRGAEASWDALAAELRAPRADRGEGLRFVVEPTSSPLLAALLDRIRAERPGARFVVHSSTGDHAIERGAALAFGRPLLPQYDFRAASVVVSLDADFLDTMPMSVRHSRHFAERRRPSFPALEMNRLYVVESMPTPTGTVADHRIRRRPGEIAAFAAALAAEVLLGDGAPAPRGAAADVAPSLRPLLEREERAVISAIARDLRRVGPAGVVVVGERQPPHVHALGALLNAALGSAGGAVVTTEPVSWDPGPAGQDLAGLVEDIRAGIVDTVVVLEGNPVYTAPSDLDLPSALRSVRRSFYLGAYVDETAESVQWFVPAAHYLESWGDARAYDGTLSIVQPLIRPLFGGRTGAEILAAFLGDRYPSPYALVRDAWRARHAGADFEAFWEATLRRGLVSGTNSPAVTTPLVSAGLTAAIGAAARASEPGPGLFDVGFYPDPKVLDGRFANNPWLQELPDPITKMTWGNAAHMSARTASELGVSNGDLVEIQVPLPAPPVPVIEPPPPPAPRIVAPVLVVPGHADRAVSLRLGYGRRGAELVASGVGVDANRLRLSWRTPAPSVVSVRAVPGHESLAITQTHFHLHGRPVVLSATLDEYRKNPEFTAPEKGKVLSILQPSIFTGDQWAMTIDTSICTGCSACVVACQAENNVPVVGKEGVLRSREMHWLRIDTYHKGDADTPEIVHEPMLCQHCEKAPCEYVCPVNATVHSPDGLNEMVYNRCIGTRFCSNNCPYKVRRFNWFDWHEEKADVNGEIRKLQKNPDVTVRERGVMEKCTFCVQRIRGAEIDARIEGRAIRPGEVTTACAQACPTQAIQFGSLAHEETDMVRWRNEPRVFSVLNELGTLPRVKYLAAIKNPNPEMG
jgi:Fe-S-cluster-containing dehydrogenase component